MKVTLTGLDELRLSMQEVADMPQDVIDAMITAKSEVIFNAQIAEAGKLGMYKTSTTHGNRRNTSATNRLPGQKRSYSTGALARSIRPGKIKSDKNGSRVLYVTPYGARTRGKRKISRTRNAEIGFLNEYGTKTINARRWSERANNAAIDAASKAAAAVYDRWLKSKNL